MKLTIIPITAFLMAFILSSASNSCRESIDSSTDLRYENLIVGAWFYSFQGDSGAESITFIFEEEKTARIINTGIGIDTTYHYFIENGILFLTSEDTPPDIIFSYVIEQLDLTTLVITFSSQGLPVRQVYSRTQL